MELIVLSPEPSADPPADWLGGVFKGTGFVYEEVGVLWRTVQALSRTGSIDTPGEVRALIEDVYDAEQDTPAGLTRAAQRAEGKQGAHASAANYAVLKAPDGYHANAMAWVSDVHHPTRLGDPRTTVRLTRVRPDGGLLPWVQVDGPPWKSWALSEVNVSAHRVPSGSTAEPHYADAVARVRATWGRFEQEIPLLPLQPIGGNVWIGTLAMPDGKSSQVSYTRDEGLSFTAVTPSGSR